MTSTRAPLTVAVAQPRCVAHDVTTNVAAHVDVVRSAAARVVVFPELSLTGYELDAAVLDADDPRLAPLVRACADAGTTALVGAPVAGAGTDENIAMLAVDGRGARVAYRKLYLGDAEAVRFVPGDEPAVLEVDGWRLGLAICKDTGVAEHAARAVAVGIDLYVAGVREAVADAGVVAERAVRIATTHDVGVAIAGFAGLAGGGLGTGPGGSGIWAADGSVLARAGSEPGEIVSATFAAPRPARVEAHTDLHMSGSAEVWIGVAPPVAYAAISDVGRMGEWSPENRGGTWLDGAPGTVGATFVGRNERGGGTWETTATVIEAVPPARFAFRVATPGEEHGTDWRFELRAEGEGTVVAESFTWDWTPVPDEGFRARVGRMSLDAAVREVAVRERLLRRGISQTVARLKSVLEAD